MDPAEIESILNEAYFSDHPHETDSLRKVSPMLARAKVFIDAGASLGQYTKLANSVMQGGKIIAVEADPVRFEILQRNCASWSDGSNELVPVHAALSDSIGEIEFHTTNSNVSGGLFEHDIAGASWQAITVPTTTLDALAADLQVDFIKMDIEGGELLALRGARGLLERSHDLRLFVEVHPWQGGPGGNDNSAAVYGLMHGMGYYSYLIDRADLFGRGAGFRAAAAARRAGNLLMRVPRRLASRVRRAS